MAKWGEAWLRGMQFFSVTFFFFHIKHLKLSSHLSLSFNISFPDQIVLTPQLPPLREKWKKSCSKYDIIDRHGIIQSSRNSY